MSQTNANVVGTAPWLPWPLAGSAWWTAPVRAERLALLRIGVALVLLVDLAVHYAPHTVAYYGSLSLGNPAVYAWRTEPPRLSWSLLRGVGDAQTTLLAFALVIAASLWILGNALYRLVSARSRLPPADRSGIALMIWTVAAIAYTAGVWARSLGDDDRDEIVWIVPLVFVCLACLFALFDLANRLRDSANGIAWRAGGCAILTALALLGGGVALFSAEEIDAADWWIKLLRPWQDDDFLLRLAMALWIGSTLMLLMGCCTRFFAVSTWVFAMSFANANPYLDNAGDTIRMILLFYLMLSPCAAAWSIDSLLRRSTSKSDSSSLSFVPPWAIRLIFLQMTFMYFINGIYKLNGARWLDGTSLYYVLGDLALARFSAAQAPIPLFVTQCLSYAVLAWELAFPLLALWKWPRRIALLFGILFHLGIFATMELGCFVPYALCMYLPLIPWKSEEAVRRGA